MTKYHLKRLPAPKTWIIGRKDYKYIVRPRPGAHPMDQSLPLSTLLISLNVVKTKREAKRVLHTKQILVDGKKRREVKHPVGFTDILSLPDAKQNYRLTITKKGLVPLEVDDKESKIKAVKIIGKKTMKKGKTQLETFDGRCVLVDKDTYKVGDTLVLEIPGQKIKDHVQLKEGNLIFLHKGTHTGVTGKLEKIDGRNIVFSVGKEKFRTRKKYALVIGKDKPLIKL